MAAGNQVPQLAETAARFAGHMVLRLVHDHLLRMDVMKYNNIIRNHVVQINTKVYSVKRVSAGFFFLAWIELFDLLPFQNQLQINTTLKFTL